MASSPESVFVPIDQGLLIDSVKQLCVLGLECKKVGQVGEAKKSFETALALQKNVLAFFKAQLDVAVQNKNLQDIQEWQSKFDKAQECLAVLDVQLKPLTMLFRPAT